MKNYLVLIQTQKTGYGAKGVYILFILAFCFMIIEINSIMSMLIFSSLIFLLIAAFSLRSHLYYNKNTLSLVTHYLLLGINVYTQKDKTPPIAYIALVPIIERQRIGGRITITEYTSLKYNLNLIFEKDSFLKYKTIETNEYKKVLELARKLSEITDKKILRTAGKEHQWIE